MKWFKNNKKDFANDDHRLTSHLSGLLGKVLSYHDVDGLPQIILHELGHDNCFDLQKATYLVDNPDFDHLLGVAGYCKKECPCHKKDLWQDPYSFKNDMKEAKYHNHIQNFLHYSFKRKNINLHDSSEVKDLGKDLGLQKTHFFSWKMKHGNHGLLLFDESEKPVREWRKGLLANVAALLSFCGF